MQSSCNQTGDKTLTFRLENYSANKAEQISHKIRITYKLYSLRTDGSIFSLQGQDENLDRLLTKCSRWIHSDRKYIIRKAVIEEKEEPVFKIVHNRKSISKKPVKKTKRKIKRIKRRKK